MGKINKALRKNDLYWSDKLREADNDLHNRALIDHVRENEQRYRATEEALRIASTSIDHRLEGMNEFRNQLKDQQANYLTRDEYNARHESLEHLIQQNTDSINISSGRLSGLSAGWGYVMGVIGFLTSIVFIILALIK